MARVKNLPVYVHWTKKADRRLPERIGDALDIPCVLKIKTPKRNLAINFFLCWFYRKEVIDYLKTVGVKPLWVSQQGDHFAIGLKRSQHKWGVYLIETKGYKRSGLW